MHKRVPLFEKQSNDLGFSMEVKNRKFSKTERVSNVVRPAAVQPVFIRTTIREITKPHVIARHQHMNYEIIFVDRGKYRCRHNEINLALGKNELLIIKPGDWHTDMLDGKYLRYLTLGFTLHAASGIPLAIFRDNTRLDKQHFIVNRTEFMPLFEKIRQELQVGDFISAHIQDALVTEFFYRMIRAIPRDILSDYYVANSSEASFLTKLLSVINERLTQKVSVKELATTLGISESFLFHKCRKVLHCSPANLFLKAKMDRAIQMLKSTDMLVKEVSDYLGFDNPFHFSRAFKKVFGKTPSAVKDNPLFPI